MNKKTIVEFFSKHKKIFLGIIVFFLALLLIFWLISLFKDDSPKQVYQVAVVAKDKAGASPDSSLYKGDVLLLKKGENNAWSKTEKLSYLIIKMELNQEEAQKIIQSKERDLSGEERKAELERFNKDREVSEEELKSFEEELDARKKTVLYRQYQIDMDKFKNFNVNQLIDGQPYQDKIYDWSIVEKKKEK